MTIKYLKYLLIILYQITICIKLEIISINLLIHILIEFNIMTKIDTRQGVEFSPCRRTAYLLYYF